MGGKAKNAIYKDKGASLTPDSLLLFPWHGGGGVGVPAGVTGAGRGSLMHTIPVGDKGEACPRR